MNQKTIAILVSIGMVVIVAVLIFVATRGSNVPQSTVSEQNPAPTNVPSTPVLPSPVAATLPSPLNLLDEPLADRLWIEAGSEYKLENGTLTVHKSVPSKHGFHAQIGGPHLDNYRASLEFRVTNQGSGKKRPANVQISPNYTRIFCQALYPNGAKIAYMNGNRFTDAAPGHSAAMSATGWNTMSIEVNETTAAMTINDDFCSADIPIGTKGALGLLVNFDSDATVEIRNFQLQLLNPTSEQLQELETKTMPGKTVD